MANRAQLIITITAEGRCEVSGPIHDKFVCYAMLESARDAIKDFTDKAAQSQIALAKPSDIPDLSMDRRLSFDAPAGGRQQ